MNLWTTIEEARIGLRDARRAGPSVGLVPTMGALHEGHLSLVRAARQRCGCVIVTIFVNPTQFAPGEDFNRYPRTLDRDCALLREEGVHAVFAPQVQEMYRGDSSTTVHVTALSDVLCGPLRPGHFDGVATVVTKLFNILPVDAAFFGEKDYQQLQIVRRLVRDLNLPIDIVGCPTVREPDGLAMSSRNAYLSPAARRQAASISAALFEARQAIQRGATDTASIIEGVRRRILDAGRADIQYLEIVDPESLQRVQRVCGRVRILAAVVIDQTRLIDNVEAGPG